MSFLLRVFEKIKNLAQYKTVVLSIRCFFKSGTCRDSFSFFFVGILLGSGIRQLDDIDRQIQMSQLLDYPGKTSGS